MSVSAAARHQSRTPVAEQYLETGFNYRMTDIQAAVGLVQLTRLGDVVARRRDLAERYQKLLGEIPGLEMARDPLYGTTNYQSFWIVLPDDFPLTRDGLLQRMMDRQISPRRGIMAAHLEPAYAGHPHVELPVTERLTSRSLILPLFHQMTADEQDRVVGVLRDAAGLDR
jgi:perosamine synthetase